MPELCITLASAFKKVPDIAVGTLIGSNIAHISIVVGLAAIIKPFKINKSLKRSDVFIFFFTSLIPSLLLWNNELTKQKGIMFLLLFVAAFGWIGIQEFFVIKNTTPIPTENIYIQPPLTNRRPKFSTLLISILWLIFGVVTLHISSHFITESAQHISVLLGISNLSVGLLLLGIGTNLPELAIMIASIYNNERDLALGGILGANIVGITLALGLCGVLSPTKLPAIFSERDLTSMMLATIVFALLLLNTKKIISRLHGILLIIFYSIYITSTVIY